MGFAEDFGLDCFEPSDFEEIDNYPYWVCADGTVLHITAMTDNHIMNCLRLIAKKQNWRVQWVEYFHDELNRRKKKNPLMEKIKDLEKRIDLLELTILKMKRCE